MNDRDKEKIAESFHKCLGHLGVEKTFNVMRDSYNWPDLKKIVKLVVDECQVCA